MKNSVWIPPCSPAQPAPRPTTRAAGNMQGICRVNLLHPSSGWDSISATLLPYYTLSLSHPSWEGHSKEHPASAMMTFLALPIAKACPQQPHHSLTNGLWWKLPQQSQAPWILLGRLLQQCRCGRMKNKAKRTYVFKFHYKEISVSRSLM